MLAFVLKTWKVFICFQPWIAPLLKHIVQQLASQMCRSTLLCTVETEMFAELQAQSAAGSLLLCTENTGNIQKKNNKQLNKG